MEKVKKTDGRTLKDKSDVFTPLVNSNTPPLSENCFTVIGLKFFLFDDCARSKMVVMH